MIHMVPKDVLHITDCNLISTNNGYSSSGINVSLDLSKISNTTRFMDDIQEGLMNLGYVVAILQNFNLYDKFLEPTDVRKYFDTVPCDVYMQPVYGMTYNLLFADINEYNRFVTYKGFHSFRVKSQSVHAEIDTYFQQMPPTQRFRHDRASDRVVFTSDHDATAFKVRFSENVYEI